MIRSGFLRCALLLLILVMSVTSFAAADSGKSQFSFMPTVEYDGKTYQAHSSSDVTTVLLIGYDYKKKGELIEDQEGFIEGGQSDFLMLLVFDHENKQIRQLQFDRDTMTDVKYISRDGKKSYPRRLQLCLSHAYGATQEENNSNSVWAVENLLGIAGEDDGAQVDWYMAMDITGINRLNNLLGGVTVPIEDDFSHYDETMTPGKTMKLTGRQAQIYCRQRYYIGTQDNKNRMRRQRVYIKAAAELLKEKLNENPSFANKLLNGMGVIFDTSKELDAGFGFSSTDKRGTPITDTPTHYLMTNQSLDGIVSLMLNSLDYEVCPTENLPGEHVIGSIGQNKAVEFIAEEDSGIKWALDALYYPIN